MRNKRMGYILCILLFTCLLSGCNGKTSEEAAEEVIMELGELTEEKKEVKQPIEETSEEDTETATEEEEREIATEEAVTEESAPVELQELSTTLLTAIQPERDKGAQVSIVVKDMNTGDYVSLCQGQQQSASLIKLYVAGALYERLGEMRTQESYEGETEELIKKMITVSDNDATNTLVARLGQGDANVGMSTVNDYCQRHGFSETYMGRLMLDFNSTSDNYTTVTDCAAFLTAIHNGELEGSEKMLEYMKQQERTGKLPAGVPDGVQTANKTGELDDVENDVAFVFADGGAYVVCVMMSDLQDTSVGRTLMVDISSKVYDYMSNR